MSVLTPEGMLSFLEKRENELRTIKMSWDSLFEDISNLIVPNRGDFSNAPKGGQLFNEVLDSTGPWAAIVLSSAVNQFLTDTTSRWFYLETSDSSKMEDKNIRGELQDQEDILYNEVFNNPDTGFETAMHEMYLDVVSYGTGVVLIEDLPGKPITFRAFSIKNCWIDQNFRGQVDTVYRRFNKTARQLLEEYGKNNLPEEVLEASEKSPNKTFECVHAVGPDEQKFLTNRKFYAVTYLTSSGGNKSILRLKGYNEFPYIVPRWLRTPEEVYGRGPGVNSLPAVRLANAMKETIIKGGQLRIGPPMDIPFEAYMSSFKMTPFAANYRLPGNPERAEPLFTGAEPGFGYDLLEPVQQEIMRMFFIDQLRLAEKTPQMTATEVLKRNEDQMRVMGPNVSRLHTESNTPMLRRVIGIANRRKMFKPSKAITESLLLRYASPVSRAQKATQATSFNRMLEAVGPMLELKPEVLDKINGDGVFDWFHKLFDVPFDILHTEDDVKRTRKRREDAKVREENSTNFNNAAAGAKSLAEAGQITRSGV